MGVPWASSHRILSSYIQTLGRPRTNFSALTDVVKLNLERVEQGRTSHWHKKRPQLLRWRSEYSFKFWLSWLQDRNAQVARAGVDNHDGQAVSPIAVLGSLFCKQEEEEFVDDQHQRLAPLA